MLMGLLFVAGVMNLLWVTKGLRSFILSTTPWPMRPDGALGADEFEKLTLRISVIGGD